MAQVLISAATTPEEQVHDLHAWLGREMRDVGEVTAGDLQRAIAEAAAERGMFIGPEERAGGLVATPAEAVLSWTERVHPGPACAHVVIGSVEIRAELPDGDFTGTIEADGVPAAAICDVVDEGLFALGLERADGAQVEAFWRPGGASLPDVQVTGLVEVMRRQPVAVGAAGASLPALGIA